MNKRLKVLFWASIAVSLVLVLLFETNVLLPGALADEVSVQFVVVTLLELLTICCIPLAVRMFRFKKIRGDIKNGHYMKWAFLRLSLLALLLVCNTLLYYIYMNTTFGYLGIILVLCLPFVYPSLSRCEAETEA